MAPNVLRLVVLAIGALLAWSAEPFPLHPAPDGVQPMVVIPSSGDIALTRDGDALVLAVTPQQDAWPGIRLRPAAGVWDLARFGRIEAEVENTGVRELTLGLRADNGGQDGSEPVFNWGATAIPPGETRSVVLTFGWDGRNRAKTAIDPARITQVILYCSKPEHQLAYRVKRIAAGGSPGDEPLGNRSLRIRDGVLFGPGCAIDGERAIRGVSQGSIEASAGGGLRLVTTAAAASGGVIAPRQGCWNLRDHLQVSVALRNRGDSEASPRIRVLSIEGQTAWAASGAPLAAGAEAVLVASFAAPQPWTGELGQPGLPFASDVVTGVEVQGGGAATLEITAVHAGLPAPEPLPEWLGKRPPVAGDWVQTLAEEFDGSTLDTARWDVYGENWWDKVSHFSRDNVILGGGSARLRYEIRRGHHNDDPKRAESDHTTGFLTSVGKWTQCYGYFEARMRVPESPGLWPAFWMMPDRGAAVADRRERFTTRNMGMEFDIFEYMVRYGRNRYNIAMHWDDYGKDHKSVGSGSIYAQPDAEGYTTAGLLWEPGKASLYANGRLVGVWSDPRVASVPAHFLFTLPSGGWGGNNLDGSGLPGDFEIDWVRAWQLRERMVAP